MTTTDLTPALQRLATKRSARERAGEAWERQTGESAKAFAAFVIYRDGGADRSLSKVMAHPDTNNSHKRISEWATTHRWVERARAYDNHLDRLRRRAREQEIEEMERRHVQVGRALQGAAVTYLDKHLKSPEQLRKLNPNSAARFIDLGVTIERKALGADREDRTDSDELAERVIDPAAKADLFKKIFQMAANMAAVRDLPTGRAPIPVASEEVAEPEIPEAEGP